MLVKKKLLNQNVNLTWEMQMNHDNHLGVVLIIYYKYLYLHHIIHFE
jgi:hypothetical protein